jgi:hypothetical protein
MHVAPEVILLKWEGKGISWFTGTAVRHLANRCTDNGGGIPLHEVPSLSSSRILLFFLYYERCMYVFSPQRVSHHMLVDVKSCHICDV